MNTHYMRNELPTARPRHFGSQRSTRLLPTFSRAQQLQEQQVTDSRQQHTHAEPVQITHDEPLPRSTNVTQRLLSRRQKTPAALKGKNLGGFKSMRVMTDERRCSAVFMTSQAIFRRMSVNNNNHANHDPEPKTSAAKGKMFSARIRTLTDHHARIVSGQQPPSGLEIVNTLRYFQQTLLGHLKEANREESIEIWRRVGKEQERLGSNLPTLTYAALYYAVCNIIEVYGQVTSGQIALGHSLLSTIKALYLFLDRDTVDQMPYNMACLLGTFPKELHTELMQILCDVLLPYCLYEESGKTYATYSVGAIVMLVFMHTAEPSHHTWLLETLMSLRTDVYQDVIAVIACGTSESRVPSANLLFHYWPLLNPHVMDRKSIQYRPHAWTPSRCQHRDCSSANQDVPVVSGGGFAAAPSDFNASMDSGGSTAVSAKKLYDPWVCVDIADSAPPVMLCKQCADNVQEQHNKSGLVFTYQPMPTTNVNVCQNKGCQSTTRVAVCTCFSEDCIRAHQHVPIRLCLECHSTFHSECSKEEAEEATDFRKRPHVFHTRLPCPWNVDAPMMYHNTIESIVKLLKETSFQLDTAEQQDKRPKWMRKMEAGQAIGVEVDDMADEKRMLSRFGIWLLAGLCKPEPHVANDAIGYLTSMVFQWFGTTALLPNDPMGAALESMKTDFACDWLHSVVTTHKEIFVLCLLPRPPEYAKVGGMWDKMSTRLEQIKEGLNKVLSLQPYDVISFETWHAIMPEWLEAICNEVPEDDIGELKVLLCKLFEPDLCTMSFSVDQTYQFISQRLGHGDPVEQQKALDWLVLLSECEIAIPMDVILKQITEGAVQAHQQPPDAAQIFQAAAAAQQARDLHPIIVSRVDSIGDVEGLTWHDDDDIRLAVACGALSPQGSPMRRPLAPVAAAAAANQRTENGQESNALFYSTLIDVIHRQSDLAELKEQNGFESTVGKQVLGAVACVCRAPWHGEHTCHLPDTDNYVDCTTCQQMLMFSEILFELFERFCPKAELKVNINCEEDGELDEYERELDDGKRAARAAAAATSSVSSLGRTQSTKSKSKLPTGSKSDAPAVTKDDKGLHTAAIEESAVDEYVGVLPTEEYETATAQASTLTENDVSHATCQITTSQMVGEQRRVSPDDAGAGPSTAKPENPYTRQFWETSVGKFRFLIDELPPDLQVLFSLMNKIDEHKCPDVQYFLLHSVKMLCLHCGALANHAKEHRGFILWAQENLLVPKLFGIMRSEYSQLAHISVPLLLHCLTLPGGADAFWHVLIAQMTSPDWTVRFACVGLVSQLCMFVDVSIVRRHVVLQGALAAAFTFFICAADDPVAAVSQRTLLLLEAQRPSSLQAMIACVEVQFDHCVLDRPLLLHRIMSLLSLLPDQQLLSMEFFLQRFDTLAVEAQLNLNNRLGDLSASPQDLLHTDAMTDMYQRKMTRARRALEQPDTCRSIIRLMHECALPHQRELIIQFELEALKETDKCGRCPRCLNVHLSTLPCDQGPRRRSRKSRASANSRISRSSGLGANQCAPGTILCPRCQAPQKGWHRCSLSNPAAMSAHRKVRKVIMLVRVMQTWSLMKRRMSAISSVSGQSIGSFIFDQKHKASRSGSGTSACDSLSLSVNNQRLRGINSANSAVSDTGTPTSVTGHQFNVPLIREPTPDIGDQRNNWADSGFVLKSETSSEEDEESEEEDVMNESLTVSEHRRMYNFRRRYSVVDHYYGGDGNKLRLELSRLSQRRAQLDNLTEGRGGNRPREFTDQESNFCLTLHKAIDYHASERHTLFLTTALFMKYVSLKTTTAVTHDEKAMAKKQNMVFRHLNTLLGFSNTDSCFTIAPDKLRLSVVSNAVLSNLPMVLDNNLSIGNQFLTIALALLRYLPSPQRLASDAQPADFALSSLNTHQQHNWLWTLLLILYKYRFNVLPYADVVMDLIKIVRNVLRSHVHKCGDRQSGDLHPHEQPTLFSRRHAGDDSFSGLPPEWLDALSFTGAGGNGPVSPHKLAVGPTALIAAPWSRRTSYSPSMSSQVSQRLRSLVTRIIMMSRVLRSWQQDEKLALATASSAAGPPTIALTEVTVQPATPRLIESSGSESDNNDNRSTSKSGGHRKNRTDQSTEDVEKFAVFEMGEKTQPNTGVTGPQIFTFDQVLADAQLAKVDRLDSNADDAQTEAGPPVESRIKQQIDEFDRSFSRSSDVGGIEVPTVVVTVGDLARQEKQQLVAKAQVHRSPYSESEVHYHTPPPVQLATESKVGVTQGRVQVFTVSSNNSQPASIDQISSSNSASYSNTITQAQVHQSNADDAITHEAQINSRTMSNEAMSTSARRLATQSAKGSASHAANTRRRKQTWRQGDAVNVSERLCLRCTHCNQPLHTYEEETLNLAIICLSTYIQREPTLAAECVPDVIQTVARIVSDVMYPWQAESTIFVPGNTKSVARQFLRVVLHQLAPNALFLQLFQTKIEESAFFKAIVSSLADFTELSPVNVVLLLFENLQAHWCSQMRMLIENLSSYVTCVPTDLYTAQWASALPMFDTFLRRYLLEVTKDGITADWNSLVSIMNYLFKVQNFGQIKGSSSLAECFAKLISQGLEMCPVSLLDLLSLCTACNRAFIKDRERQCISRSCVNQLLQAIKFKITLPESNYVVLLNVVLQDCGEQVGADIDEHMYNTGAAECGRPFIQDCVDFVADLHVLNRIKSLAREMRFKEDTLGGDLKAGLSQYIAIEIARGSARDPRTVLRYLPWLLTPPSVTQQGEFVDCVEHVRVLSWVLLGALQSTGTTCDTPPVPIESSQHIADQIQFVLAGFAEQSKESVVHMSALFHAFHLCQLWTVYCEQAAARNADSALGYEALANVMDFWSRVTPAILQLLSHSKVLADMVNLHFLNTIEALQECQSAILTQLYPMWHPILSAYHSVVPSQLRVRLDAYENSVGDQLAPLDPWLRRVRFKISQVELQSSAATQFYSV